MSEEATQLAPDMNLADVPDLSGIGEDRPEPWENGWYAATAVQSRSFTNRDTGATTTFASGDEVSKGGDSRNITIQVQVKRKNGDVLNGRIMANYKPEFLTADVIAQVTKHKEAQKAAKEKGEKAPEWGPLFRAFSALQDIARLQRVAGVRQFVRNPVGGLDITPVFGKTIYVRLGEDDRNPKYKAVVDFSDAAPKKGVL